MDVLPAAQRLHKVRAVCDVMRNIPRPNVLDLSYLSANRQEQWDAMSTDVRSFSSVSGSSMSGVKLKGMWTPWAIRPEWAKVKISSVEGLLGEAPAIHMDVLPAAQRAAICDVMRNIPRPNVLDLSYLAANLQEQWDAMSADLRSFSSVSGSSLGAVKLKGMWTP